MRRYCTLALMVALLAGCGAAQNAPGVPLQSGRGLGANTSSYQDYLYIASPPIGYDDSALYIYTYPELKHVITVGNPLVVAAGECADGAGNVYIVNQLAGSKSQVLVYDRGTIYPSRTLTFNGEARQCSISADRTLAVMTPAHLLLFTKAKGKPKEVVYPQNFTGYACDFDDKGNLFFVGLKEPSKSEATLTELPNGSSQFVDITMSKISEAEDPGGIRWDGKYLAISDGAGQIYRLTVQGNQGRRVSSLTLRDTSSVTSIWIYKDSIIGSSAKNPIVKIWDYPKGGPPTKTIENVGRNDGIAISAGR